MKELLVLIALFWAPVVIVLLKNILWSLYFWQIKEYRWDRFWTHIRWDQEDRNRNSYLTGLKFIIFAFLTFLFTYPGIGIISILFAYIIWTIEAFEFAKDFIQQNILKPSIKSIRNILIVVLYFSFITVLIALISIPFIEIQRSSDGTSLIQYLSYVSQDVLNNGSAGNLSTIPDIYLLLALFSFLAIFIDIASPIITPVFVLLTFPFAYLKRELVIYRARKKLHKLNKLKIIGITGSQGKTTTKEILFELLKDSFRTAKTPENMNTDFGVARTILDYVNSDTEVLIAEMGTYKKGELAKICKSFPPDISIITDIDTQHVGLFGSRQRLARGKAEIAEFLKADGQLIVNGDNQFCLKIAKNIRKNNFIITSEEQEITSSLSKTLTVGNIKSEANKTELELTYEKITYPTQFNYGQRHLWINFGIAFATGMSLGLNPEIIAKKIKDINIKLPRLEIETGDNNFTIVNDSYNSSLKGFVAAVDFMNQSHKPLDGKRIIVTKGIYELGKLKSEIYKNLLEKISDKFDLLITSDIKLAKTASEINDPVNVIYTNSSDRMLYEIRKLAQPGDTILLEGRLHPKILSELVSDKK